MQALMLAAGMGTRLGKYTEAKAKCMIEVGGKSLIGHAADALKLAGISKLIVVVGWESEKLISFIEQNITGIECEFIQNRDYATTNNIYSLYLAKDRLCQDDTILLESDLIFDSTLIRRMVESPEKNLVAVAKYEQWMDGTVTTLTDSGTIRNFIDKKHFRFSDAEQYYKTVNIYKLSREFSEQQYIPFLEAYLTAFGKNQYYEAVLGALVQLDDTLLNAFVLRNETWYEVDDAQDLDIANTLFATDSDKLVRYEFHDGGNWRFPGLTDFCYPANPYFPTPKMKDQIRYSLDSLITQPPSGMDILKLLAGKIFSTEKEYMLVGSNASGLMKPLSERLSGTVTVCGSDEAVGYFGKCGSVRRVEFSADKLIAAAQDSGTLFFCNPDNAGRFLGRDDVVRILGACRDNGTRCIIDETYADYADREMRFELISNQILTGYPNLVVLKNLSHTFGVPGLQVSVMACSDEALINSLGVEMPVWNISSVAEYFMQIYSLYKKDFAAACGNTSAQRAMLIAGLKSLPGLEVYPSQANYVVCRVNGNISAKELASKLLYENRILVRELSDRDGFPDRQHIRVTVRQESENALLLSAMKEILQPDR